MYERAQLERLATLLGLALADDIEAVLDRLAGPVSRYAELEVRSDGRRLDLVTLDDDPDVADDFVALLARRGATDGELAAIRSLARFGAGATLGMKLPIAGAPGSGKLYVRTALPLAEASYLLGQHDVPLAARDRLQPLAARFDKGHLHMLSVDAAARPTFACFVTTWLEPGNEPRDEAMVGGGLADLGVPPPAVERALTLHRLLAAARPETLYFSWAVAATPCPPGAKLDYAGVRLGLVAELFAAVGAEAEARKLARGGRELQVAAASYAGMVVGAAGPVEARAYFTRRA